MTKKKKVLVILLSLIGILLMVLFALDSKLTKKTKKISISAYSSKGNYDDFPYNLSEHDFKVLAAGSTGVFEKKSTDLKWEYNINHIHTISWGYGAYSYINDSCDIYYSDGAHYAGYSDRNIRLKWKLDLKSGEYNVVEAYEYITPGIINSFFDKIS
ncbi:hypothetical protein [Ruminococcus flavefaciens]|uniref:hypothetical protein n=1 Tax=Ruminococcus flavefaciens TaxID=1265 RepID=UPI0026F1B3B9|nr:hypothetical protein [Ruminococcus flavefaciens]